jgi:hypothetical protein
MAVKLKKTLNTIIDATDDCLIHVLGWMFGLSNYANNSYFPKCIQQVKFDIDEMNEYLDFSKFERDREPEFQKLLERYKKNYCPSFLHRFFSDEHQLEYLELRVEIDDIIKKSESHFSDFLTPKTYYDEDRLV